MSRPLRLAVVATALALLGGLAANEISASTKRSLAGAGPVHADVDAAHQSLAQALLEREAACARVAEQALDFAGDETDTPTLFEVLEQIPLPRGAGVHLEDRYGRMLAWVGSTVQGEALDEMPRDRDGGVFITTSTARRLAVRRTRTSPVDGVAVLAVCHQPIAQRYPVRTPFLESGGIEDDAVQSFRIGAARVLPPADMDDDTTEGQLLPSAFGDTLARIVVEPLSSESWLEAIDETTAERRASLFAALLTLLGVVAWFAVGRVSATRPVTGRLLQAAVPLAWRGALIAFPASSALGEIGLTDAARYAGALPYGLGGSPADLLLTAVAVAFAAAGLRAAAADARGSLPAIFAVALLAALALPLRYALGWVVDDVVQNSTLAFLPATSILPGIESAAILVALLAFAGAAVLTIEALWRATAPPSLRGARAQLIVVLLGAAVVAPWGGGDAPTTWWLVLLGIIGFAAAMAPCLGGRGAAVRCSVVPLGLALAMFPPLQRTLDSSLREEVVYLAEEREELSGAEAEMLAVRRALQSVRESQELADAIGAIRPPRDLAARLWADSALSQRTEASGLEIIPRDDTLVRQSFSADLPPKTWLPDPNLLPGGSTEWVAVKEGRGFGHDGLWVVGETPIMVGDAMIGSVIVWLESRPPKMARLLEFDRWATFGDAQSRRPPPPARDSYDHAGALEDTESPYSPMGPHLEADVVEAVIGNGETLWRQAVVGEEHLDVLLTPRVRDGERTGVLAFSVETGGPRVVLLRATKAAFVGALLSILGLLLTAPIWARGARLRLSHRLVLSYVVVSTIPLFVLAYVNRELVRQRGENAARRQLREAVLIVSAHLDQSGLTQRLATLGPEDRDLIAQSATANLADRTYIPGHRANLFLGHGLIASNDQGLYDTDLLPVRLPGRAYHQVLLLGRPFHVESVAAGDTEVEIGYGPMRDAEGRIFGAVSVPMLHQRRQLAREEANAVTAVLGFYLASIAAAMALGSLLATRLTAPLAALRNATRRVAAGDLSEPVPAAGKGELGQVVDAFNSMMSDLSESREKLVKAEKEAAWRDMARQVAHEVKNPLTPMRLAAEHIRRAHNDESPQFDSILQRAVDVIIRQTESLKRIVTDFRDFARLPVQRREPVDMTELVPEVLDLYRGVPELTIESTCADDVPAVLADPGAVRRVLLNVAGNSVEALEGREGHIESRVEFVDGRVVLTLRDDGPGIPDDAMPKIFEPSFSTKTGGTGLGLAICKRTIDDLGGTIEIESVTGEGTTVTISLPPVEPA